MNKPCTGCEYAYKIEYPDGRVYYNKRLYKLENDNITLYQPCSNCEKYKKYSSYLESRRQYFRGEAITSVDKFLELQRKGEDLFYLNNSIRHIGWLNSMQFRNLTSMITDGRICRAIKKQ